VKTLASCVHDLEILPVGLDLHGLGRQGAETVERMPGAVTSTAPALPSLFKQVGASQLVTTLAGGLPRVPVTAVAEGILGVLGLRTPIQVLGTVVAGQIVLVEGPQAGRSRTNERLRDESVNADRTALTIATERYAKVSRLRACVETQNSALTVLTQRLTPSVGRTSDDAIEGADTPPVTDFVQILEANHWTPALWGGHG
jgi:hypothetical protein